jgi:hypothetical protein
LTRIGGHESIIETEFVRPEWRGDGSPRGGFTDFPGPEEVILKIKLDKKNKNKKVVWLTWVASILLNANCLMASLVA